MYLTGSVAKHSNLIYPLTPLSPDQNIRTSVVYISLPFKYILNPTPTLDGKEEHFI